MALLRFFPKTAVRAKVPTNAAPMAETVRFPWGFLCFLLKSAGRAQFGALFGRRGGIQSRGKVALGGSCVLSIGRKVAGQRG